MSTTPVSDNAARRRSLAALAGPVRLGGIIGCLLVLLVAGAGWAGGFAQVPPSDLPAGAEDEWVEGSPWRVRVNGVGLFGPDDALRLNDERNHWLVLSVDVEITAPETMSGPDRILYVTGIDGLGVGSATLGGLPGIDPPDQIRMVRDDSRVLSLHPGLPERLLFFWERSADAGPPPAEIRVEITSMTYRESTLSGAMEWLDLAPAAQVTLPLQDLRERDLSQDDQ